MSLLRIVQTSALALAMVLPLMSHAAGGGVPLPKEKWSHKGPFGRFDQAALKRGAQVATEVCMGCHSIKYIKYDHLRSLGFTEEEIRDMAAANDKTKKDRLISGLSEADAKESYNLVPPDLSLMTKARKGYEDYTYAILTGYLNDEAMGKVEAAMEDETVSDAEAKDLAGVLHMDPHNLDKVKEALQRISNGDNFNIYFPGHFFAMPAPLTEDAVEYADGTKATLEQLSHDVTSFLAWTAEPTLEERKSIGVKVIIYLVILTFLLYAVKRRVWAKLH